MASTRCRRTVALGVAGLVAVLVILGTRLVAGWRAGVGDAPPQTWGTATQAATAAPGEVVAPPSPDNVAGLAARAAGGPVETSEWNEDGGLEDVARARLESYRDEGAVLVRAGYVDLLGRTWGCVVALDGGAEACWVTQADGGGPSHVVVARMEGSRWRDDYGAQAR